MNISKQLINGFIKSELELFKEQFDERPIPEVQDNRGLAIAWLCYFFRDSITNENSTAIIQFVDDIYSRDNYNTHGWIRISALQAAAFILTSDIHYANSLIRHIACGQSWARGFIIESVSVICPLLSFDNQYLKEGTEINIKHSHGYYEENTILFLSTQGTVEEKKNWLEHQISIDEMGYHKEFLNGLKKAGKLCKSGIFVRRFNKVKSYLIFKLISHPVFAEIQGKLFGEAGFEFNELIEMEQKHPLNDYYIDLSFLEK
ncbi:hypothetical protein [Daejeonella sp. H1SJ63]|uniref:hypothetical protein n=1 Tax=Daejeonella sp. H1SJ63 TaxID=3034145 RepID=UPI0023EBFD05|nr:hypothetical protein [Daejeonella sp. H1SJ63]